MRMVLGLFTILTEVKIRENTALVADTNDWIHVAAITCNVDVSFFWVHGFVQVLGNTS